MRQWGNGAMRQYERLETARLVLTRPADADAEAIFERYAADPDVTRLLAWPTHRSVDDTRLFLEFSDAEWERGPVGPYLIWSRDSGALLGATGLSFDASGAATTGYVLARDAWGRGYATEALQAMVSRARELGVTHLSALCHPGHAASIRVLEKCGFAFESLRTGHSEFPNLALGVKADVAHYVRQWGS